jgi:hypothetical protein
VPGITRQAQNEKEPFPLPIRTAVGFLETGTSGNTFNSRLPFFFTTLLIEAFEDSSCFAVILPN